MAVGRLVLAGIAAAGAYGVWRARQQAGSTAHGLLARGGGSAPSAAAGAAQAAVTLPDQSSPLPAEPTGSGDTGAATSSRAAGSRGTAGASPAASAAAAATEAATALPDQSSPLPAEPTGGTGPAGAGAGAGADDSAASGRGTPAGNGGAAGTAPLHDSGTRGDDPLTGVTEPAGDLPEASASPDGTPAAGPVETRHVGDGPA